MLKQPKPKKFTDEDINLITKASAAQTGNFSVPKSYDATNFPAFENPINQKVLVYIPNHVVVDIDGSTHLNWDKFAAHAIFDGHSYSYARCSNGVELESLGLDNSCPLCDSVTTIWELYNQDYRAIAKSKGMNIDAPEAKDALADDRKKLIKKMPIKKAEPYVTFPIVVIDCTVKDGIPTTAPRLNENNQLSGKPFYYSCREAAYTDKWVAGFDSIQLKLGEEEVTHPGGRWAILNYTYTPSSGEHTKMGSANALKVVYKTMDESFAEWATYFDKLTEAWTPQKAREVMVLNAVRDMEEMNEVNDSLMQPVNERLAMYRVAEDASFAIADNGKPKAGNAEGALANFGAIPATGALPAGTQSSPQVAGGIPVDALEEQATGVQ